MRTAFVDKLLQKAGEDPNLWLLCGDLGFSVLEPFAERHPGRFVNVGISEQNMVGVASGLALAGQKVVIYSIVNFAVMRCLEQIRNEVCYHELDVKVVAVGAGMAYGAAGYSHHGVEDVAVMASLPGMPVYSPADDAEASRATEEILATSGPAYLRLGRASEKPVHAMGARIESCAPIVLRRGKDITLIGTGATVADLIRVAERLRGSAIDASVISCPRIHPLDWSDLEKAIDGTGAVLVAEEHARGGLCSTVAEGLVAGPNHRKVDFVRLEQKPVTTAGNHAELRKICGLAPEAIEERCLRLLGHGAS